MSKWAEHYETSKKHSIEIASRGVLEASDCVDAQTKVKIVGFMSWPRAVQIKTMAYDGRLK